MDASSFFISPFSDFAFMKRALAAALILAMGGAPLGVFMSLRRMTLVGDALGHAILPGVAISFLISGYSVGAMTLGGVVAAAVVALAAVLLVRFTRLKEDGAFTLVYLLSLALGVVLLSLNDSRIDLLHLLFGDVLAIDEDSLVLITAASCLSLFVVAAFYRRFVVEGVDPDYLRVASSRSFAGEATQLVFFLTLMLNLVAAFQVLGTLMALGLIILPALAARFWMRSIDRIIPLSIVVAGIAAYAGLLLSYHGKLPAGPAIVLVAGGMTLFSALIGRVGSFCVYFRNARLLRGS
jgi:zinc/manganese transport system permease protein